MSDPVNQPEKPFEKFRAAMKQILAVPKAEIEQREAEYQKARKSKKADSRDVPLSP